MWKFRNYIKYNNKKFDKININQMLKIELKSNRPTALITKPLLLNII